MIELFPYDLLIIGNHCGDVSGHRRTYRITDLKGVERELVVAVAEGFARADRGDLLTKKEVIQLIAIDGVDWRDSKKAGKLAVSSASLDVVARAALGSLDRLEPTTSEPISPITGTTMLRMYDQNYVLLPRSMADHGTPIVIDNASASWHRFAPTYMASDARGHIGPVIPVAAIDAQGVVAKLLGTLFGQTLPAALWAAQREVYGDEARLPYIMIGVYPQKFSASRHDIPKYIASRLARAQRHWKAAVDKLDPDDESTLKTYQGIIEFHKHELAAIKKRWLSPSASFSRKP